MRGLGRPTGPREAVVVWAGEFFFLKQRPVAIQRPAIEELDAALIGPERAERDPVLTQTEQVAPYLFLAQMIRRTAVVRGQPTDRVDVDGLRRSRQPRRLHVFDHLQSQRRHRGLPWFEQAGATAPAPRKIASTQMPRGKRRPTAEPFSPTDFIRSSGPATQSRPKRSRGRDRSSCLVNGAHLGHYALD